MGGNYNVSTPDGIIKCIGRGKLRLGGNLFIGDYVEIELYNSDRGSIEKVLPRKNQLTRPYITNVDVIIICIAIVPKADFTLVDKLLINCINEKITPIICVNKIDLASDEFIKNVFQDYDGLADIVCVSALTGEGIEKLLNLIRGKYVCMSGQSAVGKSSIINCIVGEEFLKTGGLSQKIERGKHCTRQVEIFDIGYGIRLADTCGFSVLEMPKITPDQLSTYFTDFDEFRDDCKFKSCKHIDEPECRIKQAVLEGDISKNRYDRYVDLYKQCLEKWRKRYE